MSKKVYIVISAIPLAIFVSIIVFFCSIARHVEGFGAFGVALYFLPWFIVTMLLSFVLSVLGIELIFKAIRQRTTILSLILATILASSPILIWLVLELSQVFGLEFTFC